MIRRVKIPQITTSGSDGSATGNDATPAPVVGTIKAVHIDYSAGQPATTDVVLTTVESPVQTILTVADNKNDGWYYPRVPVQDAAGATVTYDGTNEIYEPIDVCDHVKATVSQGDDTETVDITIIYKE